MRTEIGGLRCRRAHSARYVRCTNVMCFDLEANPQPLTPSLQLVHHRPAAYIDSLSGDTTGLVRSQHERAVGNLFWLHDSLQRAHVRQRFDGSSSIASCGSDDVGDGFLE